MPDHSIEKDCKDKISLRKHVCIILGIISIMTGLVVLEDYTHHHMHESPTDISINNDTHASPF